jgi:hypothetical protein
MLNILEKKRNSEDSATFRANIHRVGNAVKMVEATGDVMHIRIALAQSGLGQLEDEAIADPKSFCRNWRLAFAQLKRG